MKRAVVVGTGAGGATVAKEIQGHFDVTILEAGKAFRPFSLSLKIPEKLKKSGLMFDEKLIQLLFPTMRVRKTDDRMILINAIGHGGTTTICAGNAVRKDEDLNKLGIDLDQEFEELYREVPVSVNHDRLWRKPTRQLFEICQEMGLDPQPTPKMGYYEHCRSCGHCILGCPHGVKWDSRQFLRMALDKGARLLSGCKVEKVVIENGRSTGVLAKYRQRLQFFPADLVILAAGGLGTPVILQNSGIQCKPHLFVDPVLCVACERPNSFQNKEIPMPFVSQKQGYILSPYFDPLSFYFNRKWKSPAKNILSLMIKLADANAGTLTGKTIDKSLTTQDHEKLEEAVALCVEILERLGVKKDETFLGTINAGHPGGMLPLTTEDAQSMHSPRLPGNLYAADATLLPRSLGNPPILTIMAMAKRIAKVIQSLKTG
jgi:choline dehydrogenase-like flavoprotein